MLAALSPLVLGLLLVASPVPTSVTATVTLHPEAKTFEVEGVWRFDAPGAATFDLAPGVRTEFTEAAAEGSTVVVPPGEGGLAFRSWGTADDAQNDFVRADQALLKSVVFAFYPRFYAYVEASTCIVAPEGWWVGASGDLEGRCFRAPRTHWVLVAARRDHHDVSRGAYRVVVEDEATAIPLLDATEEISAVLEGWYGPRPSESLTVAEMDYDGGFSSVGLIVLHPGAVRAFREGVEEVPFLAHEIAHQWFGGVFRGPDALREGLATYTALRYERGASRGDAYVAKLLERAAVARPGRTIRTTDREHGWDDYDAVAYARAALVFDALEDEIGEAAMSALLRGHLGLTSTTTAASVGDKVTWASFFAPLESIAPDFDRDAFVLETIDGDWDPATRAPRSSVWTLDGWIAAAIVGVATLIGLLIGGAPRERLAMIVAQLVVAAGVAALFARVAWTIGWPVAAGAVVIVAAGRSKRYWWIVLLGYGVAASSLRF